MKNPNKNSKIILFTLTLLALSLEIYSTQEFIEIQPTEIESHIRKHELSLIMFGDTIKHKNIIQELEISSAIRLLKDDVNKIALFKTSIEFSKESKISKQDIKTRYLIKSEPSLRLFWRGIMLTPPSNTNFKGILIYRWLRQAIRSSQIPKVKITDTDSFFEKQKEEFPYMIIGLGDQSSTGANFLGEFSKMPKSPFEIYMMDDGDAKRIFQSQGLSGSKFNILFLSNNAKILREYTGDLDFYMFYKWAEELARKPGVFNFNSNTNYMKRNIILNKTSFVFFGVKNNKTNRKNRFRKSIQRVAERLDIDILWGKPTGEYKDEVDYIDCKPLEMKNGNVCGYLYKNFENKELSQRYRIVLPKFDEDTLEVKLGRLIKSLEHQEPYKFSDNKPLPNLSRDSFIKPLSLNTLDVLKNSKKDCLILSYMVCGSNCQEKLKIVAELEQRLSKDSLNSINVYTLNLKKNELPAKFYEFSTINIMYVRKTNPGKLINLKKVTSSFDLIEQIKKHSTTDIVDISEEDKELEDYI